MDIGLYIGIMLWALVKSFSRLLSGIRHTCLLCWFLGSYELAVKPKKNKHFSPGVAPQPSRRAEPGSAALHG